ncbi:MAG: lipid A biosynthesis acyltransferase [Gammaproteobacteria bacterium]|nr:lipid A biosynthesis acyltransferase [Gammaproteobacteria bacterium]
MKQAWLQQKERGSVTGLVIASWLARILGRRFCRAILHPVCLYFVLFAPAARRASVSYLDRALTLAVGRRARWRHVYRHLYCFASTILDRFYFLVGAMRYFEINKYGLDVLRDTLDRHGACVFLGAHVGSFELLRVGGARNWSLTLNVLMYEDNAQKMQSVLTRFGQGVTLKILPVGGLDTPMRAKACIDKGESIAILADRDLGDGRMIEVPFLGGPANFPAGPFLLAAALKLPVVLALGLYDGGNRYEERFELFSAELELPRGQREQKLKEVVGQYAQRLEYYVRRHPYNWFNFYDFWKKEH